MLTETTGLSQPQNKQVTVEAMQLPYIKNVVDSKWVEGYVGQSVPSEITKQPCMGHGKPHGAMLE